MRTILAGSRSIVSMRVLEFAIAEAGWPITEVVSGHAQAGVDVLGEEWARAHGIALKLFPADWERYGKGAGPRRNTAMAEYAEAAIIVWDGSSPGSRDMLKKARRRGLRVHLHVEAPLLGGAWR